MVGASKRPGTVGNDIFRNLLFNEFRGTVYPINPKADEILGRKAYKSVKDVPGDIDVAVFAVPAKFCIQALEEVGEKGIPGAIMIPSGFAETGETALQAELVATARRRSWAPSSPSSGSVRWIGRKPHSAW